MTGSRAHTGRARIAGHVVAGLGTALLVATLPFYLAAGLMAPLWAVLVLLLVWLALFTMAIRWFRPHPWWVPGLPLAAITVWLLVMYAGERFLGWTA